MQPAIGVGSGKQELLLCLGGVQLCCQAFSENRGLVRVFLYDGAVRYLLTLQLGESVVPVGQLEVLLLQLVQRVQSQRVVDTLGLLDHHGTKVLHHLAGGEIWADLYRRDLCHAARGAERYCAEIFGGG